MFFLNAIIVEERTGAEVRFGGQAG